MDEARAEEVRGRIRAADAKFRRDTIPLIEAGQLFVASTEASGIAAILSDVEEDIGLLPSGLNYLASLHLIFGELRAGRRPSKKLMEEYGAYCAQVMMKNKFDYEKRLGVQ